MPVHPEVDVFELMGKWIERYRRQAEQRYRRLDAELDENSDDRDALGSSGMGTGLRDGFQKLDVLLAEVDR